MSDYERGYKQGVEDAHRCEQRHAQIDQLEADVRALRAENARLRKAMQSAYDYITNHRHGKAKAMLFDGLELYRQAALQPKEATWHAK